MITCDALRQSHFFILVRCLRDFGSPYQRLSLSSVLRVSLFTVPRLGFFSFAFTASAAVWFNSIEGFIIRRDMAGKQNARIEKGRCVVVGENIRIVWKVREGCMMLSN